MKAGRIWYRARQFWHALRAAPTQSELESIQNFLTPALMALFLSMNRGEQAHSINIYKRLIAQGETNQDLLTAALLHDAGKSVWPLNLWERVLIVMGRVFAKKQTRNWGVEPQGSWPPSKLTVLQRPWRKPFVVAECHPEWGARLATEAGASPLSVALIQRHQEPPGKKTLSLEDALLAKLQSVDDQY
jgi:hypothetical protein